MRPYPHNSGIESPFSAPRVANDKLGLVPSHLGSYEKATMAAIQYLIQFEEYESAAMLGDGLLRLLTVHSSKHKDQKIPIDLIMTVAQAYFECGRFNTCIDRLFSAIMSLKRDESDHPITQEEVFLLARAYRFAGQHLQAENLLDDMDRIVKGQFSVKSRDRAMGAFLHRHGAFVKAMRLTERERDQPWFKVDPIGLGLIKNIPRLTADKFAKIKADWNVREILVVGEAGIGDEIIFCRWLGDLRVYFDKVYYLSDRSDENSIAQVIANNFKGVELWTGQPVVGLIPLMSLPVVLGIQAPDCVEPYIKAPTVELTLEKKYKYVIGINGSGDPKHGENKFRQINLVTVLAQLGTVIQDKAMGYADITKDNILILNFDQHSTLFQPGLTQKSAFGFDVYTPAPTDNWNHTLKMLATVDWLITCCTSIAHLAGAMGVKTCVLVNQADYFTWSETFNNHRTRWYPNTYVVRQKPGAWIFNWSVEAVNAADIVVGDLIKEAIKPVICGV